MTGWHGLTRRAERRHVFEPQVHGQNGVNSDIIFYQMPTIRAGRFSEATRLSGEWIFIDIGFAKEEKTCGLLNGDSVARVLSFSDTTRELTRICKLGMLPLNVVIEAPLSVAFGSKGNPTGRSIENRNGRTRYWYVGLGCSILVAATYLMRSISEIHASREIRLFEGFVSFKENGSKSSHAHDVESLRDVVWMDESSKGQIVAPEDLVQHPTDQVMSAFRVAGMDFGVPPVIVVL